MIILNFLKCLFGFHEYGDYFPSSRKIWKNGVLYYIPCQMRGCNKCSSIKKYISGKHYYCQKSKAIKKSNNLCNMLNNY